MIATVKHKRIFKRILEKEKIIKGSFPYAKKDKILKKEVDELYKQIEYIPFNQLH